ncbi:Acid phosphatase-like protein 2 [Mortierella sp. AD094]|nr:Acid phosphatase-like protein 2 [Mortierella sp. AD094]
MFRLVNKRLAANRELESLRQEFNQCSLPIEFVYRIVVSCVDEIMKRGLNHPFILKNTYSASVVTAMLTLMADPERRDLFSLQCMRIDTVASVMMAALKNLREAIVPMEIQEELTIGKYLIDTIKWFPKFSVDGFSLNSGASTPSSSTHSINKINTVNSLLNHANFPAVNRALLMELLNLSLAILNRSSFNRVKPDMLASILGPHIFASQHATILQHTPQQAYSYGWGVALVNDIKRCSKMFYVLLGGYRREILGAEGWEYDQGGLSNTAAFGITVSGAPLSASSLSRGHVNQWLGSTATIHGGMGGAGPDSEDDRALYFGQNNQQRLHQSVPQLRVTDGENSPRHSLSCYGTVRNVSTTLSESIRAAAAQEAKHWNLDQSSSGSKGPAALEHLRGSQCNDSSPGFSCGSYGSWMGRNQRQQKSQGQSTVEQRQQELFQRRFVNDSDSVDELSNAYRRHHIRSDSKGSEDDGMNDKSRQREQKRLAIEQMIRECRGTGLSFETREGDQCDVPAHEQNPGGLALTASRYRGGSGSGPIAVDILDQVGNEENNDSIQEGYNYCQAQRPTLNTYPAPKVKGSTLVNSQLFIRHGDRTPITVLPLDLDLTWECANTSAYAFTGFGTNQEKAPFQYANVVAHQVISIPPASPFAATHMWKGSCIPGQLTPVGAMQHRRLGAALRRIYVDELKFLPATLDPETVHIRSTDVWRTKQSAENLMAGLYGVQRHSLASPPPVLQIHILPVDIDYLTMNAGACPRISQLRSGVEKSSEVLKKLREDNIEFNKELVEILGEEKSWSGYMDTVLPRICHGMQLQCRQVEGEDGNKCITPQIANRILENVGTQTTEIYRDGKGVFEVLQLGIGPLANDIKQNLLKAKANGKIRFSFYSGHDTTISPLLGMLDAVDQWWPPYASNLLIELWKSPRGQYYIRVLYNGAILPTKSEWCDLEWCPLDAFIGYIDKFIVEDLTALCKKE